MVRNKLRHVAVGLAVAGVGVAGVLLFDGWYPVRVLSALLFVAGVAWAVVMGHLPFLLLSLLAIPVTLVEYVFFLPLRSRVDGVFVHGNRVVAWWMLPDRVVLVLTSADAQGVWGRSIFRGPRNLRRMRKKLLAANIPECPLEESRLRVAVARWNGDLELRARIDALPHVKLDPRMPLIVLDRASKAHVDRVQAILEVLWAYETSVEGRHDVMRLAVWYALAVDFCYEYEKMGPVARELI